MGAAPIKMKQSSKKCLLTTSLCYSTAKYTLYSSSFTYYLYQVCQNRTWKFQFCSHYFFFSFSVMHNSRLYFVWLLCMPNDCSALLVEIVSTCFELCVSYVRQAKVSKDATPFCLVICWTFVHVFWVWVYCQATPGLLNACWKGPMCLLPTKCE